MGGSSDEEEGSNWGKASRNEHVNGKFFKEGESPSGMQNFHSPFAVASGSKGGPREPFRGGTKQLVVGEYFGTNTRNG